MKIAIVQLYAPTNDAKAEVMDKFYSDLSGTLDTIRSQDLVIMMDINAQ